MGFVKEMKQVIFVFATKVLVVGIVIRLITVNITPVNMVTVITMDQALHAPVKRDSVAQAVAILISAITIHV